jgi:hypothetical protein
MRILFFSTSEIQGGAARAVNRLHNEINSMQNFSSHMLVKNKTSNDNTVSPNLSEKHTKVRSLISSYSDRIIAKVIGSEKSGLVSSGLFGVGIDDIDQFRKNADVLCLTWVMGGYLSINDIAKILSSGIPVVWRLSDMWPFTGGCHYSSGCMGFEKSCNDCPKIDKKMFSFFSSLILKNKNKKWNTKNLTLVAPSLWMKNMAKNSAVFYDVDCRLIHTGVDLNIFKHKDQPDAKKHMGISTNKKVILFGASNATSDKRKGFHYLVEALLMLSKQDDNFVLAIFGSSSIPKELKHIEHYIFGSIPDDNLLMLAYNAADVFVAPSIEENLANTVLESLACGTPVVAFNIGGMPDMIESFKNGYLAKPNDVIDLTYGIQWVLECTETEKLRSNSREVAVQNFDIKNTVHQFKELFQELSDFQ